MPRRRTVDEFAVAAAEEASTLAQGAPYEDIVHDFLFVPMSNAALVTVREARFPRSLLRNAPRPFYNETSPT